MKFRNKRHILLLMTSIILITSITIPSFATTEISKLENQTDVLKKKLNNINGELIEIHEELEGLNNQIQLTESQLERTTEELKVSKVEEAKQYEGMKDRIRFIYEAGDTSLLELLFGAESMQDFVNKSDFITTLTEYDRTMLEKLIEVTETIKFEEKNLIEEQKSLKSLKINAEEKEAALELKAKETSTDISSLRNQIQKAKEEEARRLAQLEQERLEQEKLEQEKLEQENNSKPEISKPGSSKPETSKPETSKPETSKPETSKPEVSKPEVSNSELDVFAALLDCEAKATYRDRMAVATVIMNRVSSSRYPNTVNGVIYQEGQFSPTWTGKLDRRLELGASSLSYEVARDAINGKRLSEVSHCYFFLYAPSTNREGIEIGDNLFFASW